MTANLFMKGRTMPHDSTFQQSRRLAEALGWFSVALGAAELATPSGVARLIGADDTEANRRTLRLFGARELAAGFAILAEPNETRGLWARVAGDGLDLGWLGLEMGRDSVDRQRLGIAAAAVAGITALDVLTARRLGRQPVATRQRSQRIQVEQVVTVNRSIHEVYSFWRDFANFPRFMAHLERVEVLDGRRSRWTATAPAGMTVHWDAEIIQDRDAEWLAWRSLPGSQVENSGSVRFTPAPGARGTEVRVQLEYVPPAGRLGRIVAMLFGEEPRQQVREDLRRFKQLMEAGEIALSDGRGLWRAAQPARSADQIRELAGVQE
jgi:uncharacterized membrane protein